MASSRIEHGLEQRAGVALDDAGIAASVRFEGRDAVLTGDISSTEEAARALILVADLPGTRVVDSRVEVRPAQGTPAPRPSSPSPSTTPTRTRTGAEPTTTPTTEPSAAPTAEPSAAPSGKASPAPTGRILFGSGEVDLPGTADATLRAVASYLARFPEYTVRIQGHSDNIGPRSLNEELSRLRAEAVAEDLAALGVDEARLRTEGFADTRPVASNRTPAGRAANRRVEIVFEGVN